MRKIYSQLKFITFNSAHSKNIFKRKIISKRKRLLKNKAKLFVKRPKIKPKFSKSKTNSPLAKPVPKFKRVIAPEVFSLINNTEQVIDFINTLKMHLKKLQKVFIDLENVTKIDFDAIIVLLSAMIRFKSKGISFNGNFPKDEPSKIMLKESGFFKHLYENFKEEDRYQLNRNNQSNIHTHAWKKVDPALTATLIENASESIWGQKRRCQGVQRTLLELMQNTNNHASSDKEGDKHWWISINHIKKEKKVSFSFLDYGIGVFKSLNTKKEGNKFFNAINVMLEKFHYGNDAELLRLILNGELHKTITAESFRGKGLPGIKEVLNRNQISNLYVITNNVFSNVSEERYSVLHNDFNGTYVYFELNNNNYSCL